MIHPFLGGCKCVLITTKIPSVHNRVTHKMSLLLRNDECAVNWNQDLQQLLEHTLDYYLRAYLLFSNRFIQPELFVNLILKALGEKKLKTKVCDASKRKLTELLSSNEILLNKKSKVPYYESINQVPVDATGAHDGQIAHDALSKKCVRPLRSISGSPPRKPKRLFEKLLQLRKNKHSFV